MRKSNEQKLYERTVKSLVHLDDESLTALIRLASQLMSARRLVRANALKPVNSGGFIELPPRSEWGKPRPQVPTASQGESHEQPQSH